MKDKLKLLLGQAVVIKQTFSNGAAFAIAGKLKKLSIGISYTVSSPLGGVFQFSAASIQEIIKAEETPIIILKVV